MNFSFFSRYIDGKANKFGGEFDDNITLGIPLKLSFLMLIFSNFEEQ